MEAIKLGHIAKDTVTGFEGVATARCTYLSGKDARILVENFHDGKVVEEWFDESRLVDQSASPR